MHRRGYCGPRAHDPRGSRYSNASAVHIALRNSGSLRQIFERVDSILHAHGNGNRRLLKRQGEHLVGRGSIVAIWHVPVVCLVAALASGSDLAP